MKQKLKQYALTGLCLLALFVLCYFINYSNKQEISYTPLLKNLGEVGTVEETSEEKELSPKELFLETWGLIKGNYWDYNLNEVNWNRWKKHYLSQIETEEDAYIAINSMLASLNDPYSKFLTPNELNEQNNSINSKIYGVGVNIASISGKIYIINVIKGAPSDLGGLRPGDMILKINNKSVGGMSVFQISNYIKGANNLVTFEILRNNKKITKKIKKAEIKIRTVESEILDKEIGYIRIVSFISSETPIEFIDALNKIDGTKALILDLRGNTGGLFQNAVFVANMFLEKGSIVNVIGRSGAKSLYKAEEKEYVYDKPLIVLVDGASASASEIVSAALKDNGRATIVGTRTYGKGVVQKVFPMPNNMGMNLTIARYLTPNGSDINGLGIEPNYKVEITKDDFEKNNDSQLNFAKNMLQNEIRRSKIAAH